MASEYLDDEDEEIEEDDGSELDTDFLETGSEDD